MPTGISTSTLRSALNALSSHRKGMINTILCVIVFLGFAILENFVEDYFKCPCKTYITIEQKNEYYQQNRRKSLAVILVTSAIIFCFGVTFLTTYRCICSRKKNINYHPKQNLTEGNQSETDPPNGEDSARTNLNKTESRGQTEETGLMGVQPRPGTSAHPTSVNDNDPNTGGSSGSNEAAWCFCYHGCKSEVFWNNALKALVLTLVWFVVLLIDGDYIACAVTDDPYGNASCSSIRLMAKLPLTKSYTAARYDSQLAGMIIALILSCIALFAVSYNACKCCVKQPKCCCCDVPECKKCPSFYTVKLEKKEISYDKAAKELLPVLIDMKDKAPEIFQSLNEHVTRLNTTTA